MSAIDMSPEAIAERLREACRLMAEPIVVVPDDEPPTAEQVEARLREACALWVLCARLEEEIQVPPIA